MKRLGIFVDAGYFWVQATTVIHGEKTPRSQIIINYEELRQQILSTAKECFPSSDLLRVYWYDGPGNTGKAIEHASIEQLDDFKLRLGTRNRTGQQKGVDGLIIADIIGLTQNKAISDALLITGDADLTPGVVAAQNLGLRVHLLTLGPPNATSPYLSAEMDCKHSWPDKTIELFAGPAPEQEDSSTHAVGAQKPSDESGTQPLDKDISSEGIEDLSKSFVDGCTPEEIELIQQDRYIPREIDAKLLRHAATWIGRRLTEDEKRGLRDNVKKKATQ